MKLFWATLCSVFPSNTFGIDGATTAVSIQTHKGRPRPLSGRDNLLSQGQTSTLSLHFPTPGKEKPSYLCSLFAAQLSHALTGGFKRDEKDKHILGMQKEPVIPVTVMIAVKVSMQEEGKLVNLGV